MIAEGRRVSLHAPTTRPIVAALYELHNSRAAYNIKPPGTLTLDEWAATFRRGFHADAAALGPARTNANKGIPLEDLEPGTLLGYTWSYEYAPEHGTCQVGALYRPDLRGIPHLEGLTLWTDHLFAEYPLDRIGIECSTRAAEQFGAFLPRLFTFDGERRGWLRHGGHREDLTLWSMTREAWDSSRYANGRYFRKELS